MADIKAIKGTDGTTYNLRDDYSKWGGTNLLRWTGDMPLGSGYIRNYRAQSASLTDTGEGIKYDSTINNGGIEIPFVSLGCVENGEVLTCSFYARGTKANTGSVYICRQTAAGSNTDNISYGNTLNLTDISETVWKYYTFTFTATNASVPASDKYAAYFMLAWGSTNVGWLEIKKRSLKLERGHKATDWGPCYKDIFTYSNEILNINL